MELFGCWLAETACLQVEAYGEDLSALEDDAYGDHVCMNVTAIISELGEFLAEVIGWKTWVTERGRPDEDARCRALGEAVDLLHFCGNLLVGLRVTDAELSGVYAAKMQRNRDRQASGSYDGRSTKCPSCRRALDDVGLLPGGPDEPSRCGACGAEVPAG